MYGRLFSRAVGVVVGLCAFLGLVPVASASFGTTLFMDASTFVANEHPGLMMAADFSGAPRPTALTVNLPAGMRIGSGAVETLCPIAAAENGECDPSTEVGYATITTAAGETAEGSVYLAEPFSSDAVVTLITKLVFPNSQESVTIMSHVELQVNGIASLTAAQPNELRQRLHVFEIPETTSEGDLFQLTQFTLALGGMIGGDHPLITNPSVCPTSPDSASLDATASDWSVATAVASYPVTGCSGLSVTPGISGSLNNPFAGQDTAVNAGVAVSPGGAPPRLLSLKMGSALWLSNPGFGNSSDRCPGGSIGTNYKFDPSECPSQARIGTVWLKSPLFRQPMEGRIWVVNKTPYPALGIEFGDSFASIRGSGTFSFPQIDPLCEDNCTTEAVVTFGLPSIPVEKLDFEFYWPIRTRPNGTTIQPELFYITPASYQECVSPNNLRVTASSYASATTATSSDPLGIIGCNSGSPLDTLITDSPGYEVNTRQPTFSFDSDPSGQADSFECKYDSSAWAVWN